MSTGAKQAADAIQAMIDATEAYDALIYGQRTLDEMGGRDWGITAEYGAADWAIAQWGEAQYAAAGFDLELEGVSAKWNLNRAKKMALAAKQAAAAELKAIGTKRQLRLALAA